MKILKFILFFLCSFLVYFNVDACTTKELSDLRKIANNIKFDYDVYLDKNEPFVYFSLYNMNDLFYITEKQYSSIFQYDKESTITKYGYRDDVSYNFVIYGSEQSKCANEVILDKYISVPKYNIHYENKLCDGIKEFVLCGKYNNFNLSNEDFIRKVNEYKEKQNKEDRPSDKVDDDKDNKILKFIVNNYIYFIVGIGIVIVGVGVIINVKKEK